MKCTFCGAEEIRPETPYIDRVTGKHEKTYCCNAQKKNADFAKKRYSPVYGDVPTSEELTKL